VDAPLGDLAPSACPPICVRPCLPEGRASKLTVVGSLQSRVGPISLLVTDLDNTLYDWFEVWYESFTALLGGISDISGVSADVLEPEIRRVHQQRGTSEYSHLIQELPTLVALHPDQDLREIYAPAIKAAQEARRSSLRLYPGVREALDDLHARGVTIAAYTESQAFYTASRIRNLGLDGVIDVLFSSPDHDLPKGVTPESMRTQPEDYYGLKATTHRNTPKGLLKPSPEVLRSIVDDLADSKGVVYVGDSLMKDVAMAQDVGVHDALAAYGAVQLHPGYALLRRVSHWTDEDVEREKEIGARPTISPSVVLRTRFDEVFDHFEFAGNDRQR